MRRRSRDGRTRRSSVATRETSVKTSSSSERGGISAVKVSTVQAHSGDIHLVDGVLDEKMELQTPQPESVPASECSRQAGGRTTGFRNRTRVRLRCAGARNETRDEDGKTPRAKPERIRGGGEGGPRDGDWLDESSGSEERLRDFSELSTRTMHRSLVNCSSQSS